MTAWQATLRRRFDRAASGYEALAQLQQQSGERLAEAVMRQAAFQKTQRILDLGCGTGWLLRHLLQQWPAEQAPSMFALDLSEGMLQASDWQSPTTAGTCAGAIKRVCADASSLPFANASIDLVVSNFALHWCDDPAQVLAEMHRVSTIDGRAFCVIPVAGSLGARGDQAGQGASLRDLQDWQQAAAQSPWQLVSSDVEQWVEHHETPAAWLNTLRALGVTARRAAASGLSGRAAYAELQRNLELAREPAGIPLRYQVWRVQLQA
ncbi:MAG: methyltransferase domain-containing protein [Pseudomonadota bacterium]